MVGGRKTIALGGEFSIHSPSQSGHALLKNKKLNMKKTILIIGVAVIGVAIASLVYFGQKEPQQEAKSLPKEAEVSSPKEVPKATKVSSPNEVAVEDDLAEEAEKEQMAKEYQENLDLNLSLQDSSFFEDRHNVGISGTVKNNGDKTISNMILKVYYKDDSGKRVYEGKYSVVSIFDGKGALKPNYVRNLASGYVEIPMEWKKEYGYDYELVIDFE